MTPNQGLLILRGLLIVLLYVFLSALLLLLWRDFRQVTRQAQQRERTQGYLHALQTDNSTASIYSLYAVTSLGRASTNTIVFADDDTTSLEHALITRRNGKWWLEDLGSRNGTFLNGAAIEGAVVISAGDVIEVGQTQLRFEPGVVE